MFTKTVIKGQAIENKNTKQFQSLILSSFFYSHPGYKSKAGFKKHDRATRSKLYSLLTADNESLSTVKLNIFSNFQRFDLIKLNIFLTR